MPDSNHAYVLGVDGGGSKTIAWIAKVVPSANAAETANEIGLTIVGRGESGPSNPCSVGFDVATKNLSAAIDEARLASSHVSLRLAVATLSLAGVGKVSERERLQDWAKEQNFAKRTMIIDDIEPLYLAAKYEHPSVDWECSITLVAGTGSNLCGRNEGGRPQRLGGWGYILGDEGSGFAIGLAALQSVCREFDDGVPLSPFHASLLRGAGLSDIQQLIDFVYQSPIPRSDIAKLSQIVFEFCSRDVRAKEIIDHAVSAMADSILRLANKLGLPSRNYSLALSGGILVANPRLVERLLEELRALNCEPSIHHIIHEPIYGPLLTARKSLFGD
jgi:N-acetylglucosamine kinase-like BadF-type ATPase